jgi:DNA helicase HerA-like ATPase
MDNITYIGETNYQSKQLRFGIKKLDRSGHIYCIGKTGTGKSTLLLNMAISDILHGEGVAIIDPHGDLSKEILDHIPKERVKDVIYFNTTDTQYPIPFNPLYKVREENRYLIASAIVTTLKKLWSESWGPRLEHVLRNTLLTLPPCYCT